MLRFLAGSIGRIVEGVIAALIAATVLMSVSDALPGMAARLLGLAD